MVRKAELSRTDVQLLTDVLLNKHADNELANHSDWIEVSENGNIPCGIHYLEPLLNGEGLITLGGSLN